MKLSKVDRYCIGLDLGSASVGWAVTDESGKLCHFKGKPTWGSRLFDEAQPASEARVHRGQRRRYTRRRWRLDLLQGFFQEAMAEVDPEFFNRLKESYLISEDRTWHNPLFNGSDFTEVDYYKRFPTIYHLRTYLMESDQKEDLRLVYLALHNIVKYRGNFLRQGEKLSARDADMGQSVERFAEALTDWCEENYIYCDCQNFKGEIVDLLQDPEKSKSEKRDDLGGLFGLADPTEDSPRDYNRKKFEKALAGALLGYKAELGNVFLESIEDSNFKLSEDEKVEAFLANCPDEGKYLFETMLAMHSAFVLMSILKGGNGRTLSYVKVDEYKTYHEDLKSLKDLVKKYAPTQYDTFFRGETYEGTSDYVPAKAMGYTKYNLGVTKLKYDDFKREVVALFADTAAEDDSVYQEMMKRFDEETFLRRQKTSDNGCIPYQLHLEEFQAILEKQGQFYPFLLEFKDELESLVTFRIPYYVGPLSRKHDRQDASGKSRFSWSTRKAGMEDAVIKPWNWEEIIDKNQCAEDFIQRMTADCTYLMGQPVLPKCSLLYEEYCVLNELNGARWTQDGDYWQRFDADDRQAAVKELFHQRKVSRKRIEDWMTGRGHSNVHVKGFQGEAGFESRMGSYIFFCKDVFGYDEIPLCDYPMIEEIILWNTLFEDRSILRDKLEEKYGARGNGRLDTSQIKVICQKRFTGWGKLSRKFLTELKTETDQGKYSIMDVMREGNPNNTGRRDRAMVLMEVIHDDALGFEKLIEKQNEAYVDAGVSIEELPGSPAIRRTLNQTMRIVEEIVKISGKEPAHIYIEETRGEDKRQRGSRTKKRYERLKESLTELKKQWAQADPNVLNELKKVKPDDLDERLTLYFMQGGKCLYSGKPIDISQIYNTGLYEVDHILPQSYIKDDSFENKALVLRSENQRKLDTLLLSDEIRRARAGYWKQLHEAKLIGDKKFKSLNRDEVSDGEMKGFINRQLVETSQSVKLARQFLGKMYPNTDVRGIKAGISHQIRDKEGLVKCREINDYHHAHDALLACAVGRFIDVRYGRLMGDPIKLAKFVRSIVKEQAADSQASSEEGTLPGDVSFVVHGFRKPHPDKETGEVLWDAEEELAEIRRSLNFKDCFISRMPQITTGSFWKATVASPHAKGKQDLPLKSDRPTEKYGSYTETHFAHFFVYEMKNKKDKGELVFSQVPVNMAPLDASERSSLLVDIASRECHEAKGEFVRIVRPVVYKHQLIEVDGERFRITGKKKMISARQLAFSVEEALFLRVLFGAAEEGYKPTSYNEKRLLSALRLGGEGLVEEVIPECSLGSGKAICDAYVDLFADIAKRAAAQCPRQADLISVENLFAGLSIEDYRAAAIVVRGAVKLINGQSDRADFSVIGGSKCASAPQPTFAKLMKQGSMVLIDQSVTGMYEKRYKLGV